MKPPRSREADLTSVAPLRRETLHEQVYEALRDLILEGGVVPGETVTVQSLADAFGVSPMPVREALKRLTEANALTVISGRSVGVPPLDRGRLADLRRVRVEVEGLAGAWAATRLTAEGRSAISAQLAELEASIASGDVSTYLRGNRNFHFAIYRGADSPTLMRIIEDLWLHVSPYFRQLEGSYVAANLHHREMLVALEKADPARMREAIKADIDSAFAVLDRTLAHASTE